MTSEQQTSAYVTETSTHRTPGFETARERASEKEFIQTSLISDGIVSTAQSTSESRYTYTYTYRKHSCSHHVRKALVQAGVNTHVRVLGEALAAVDTGERLLPSVYALVPAKVGGVREGLAAGGALVGPFPGVCALVEG